eukprot:943128-Prymnesium_polylepis.1
MVNVTADDAARVAHLVPGLIRKPVLVQIEGQRPAFIHRHDVIECEEADRYERLQSRGGGVRR